MSRILLLAAFISTQTPAAIEPFAIHIVTTPRGAEDAKERMRLAVEDAEQIAELSDWIDLVDDRDDADIVIEIKAYLLADDESVHYIYTKMDVLGEEILLVGVDERRHAERKRAVSDFMEKLQDFCAENYVRLDAQRRAT